MRLVCMILSKSDKYKILCTIDTAMDAIKINEVLTKSNFADDYSKLKAFKNDFERFSKYKLDKTY